MLSPCSSCGRHVRTNETCPFCGAACAPTLTRRASTGRLGRAALFALGAAMAVAPLTGCGDDDTPGDDDDDADAAIAAPYGAPPQDFAVV